MGRAAARRHDIKDDFEEGHIALVWNELEDRFGVNSKVWGKKFEEAFAQQPHSVGKISFFQKFLFENFNHTLNHLLCRYPPHSTTDSLMDYVVKKGIR